MVDNSSQNNSGSLTYAKSGVNYESLDPAKKLAQEAAKKTAIHLKNAGYKEISDTRGEAAFVWQQGSVFMASVTESLGTKNLVADETRKITGKTYYDVVGHDVVAAAVNDLVSVGAKPLVIHAFWAVGESEWFEDKERIADLVKGWKAACDLAGATWGGGETPSYTDIVQKETAAFGCSVVGIIKKKSDVLLDKKLKEGDRIIFVKSNGVNANGISLTRKIAGKISAGYATKLPSNVIYGEALLTKTNIYAQMIQELLEDGIDIHYISNITGHGLRKVMRARPAFAYRIQKIFYPHEIFHFIQEQSGLSDYEMYQTYNMGMDYALFIPERYVEKAQKIIEKNGFESMDAGYLEEGKKQVIIEPKSITFKGETLDLR